MEYEFEDNDMAAALTERLINELAEDKLTLAQAKELAVEILGITDSELSAEDEVENDHSF